MDDFDLEKTREMLVETRGLIDVGSVNPVVKEVCVRVTPGYAEWLKREGKDVAIMQSQFGAFSNTGPGKFAVQNLVLYCLKHVENLIDAGVPQEVALKLLPHEIYERLQIKKKTALKNRNRCR